MRLKQHDKPPIEIDHRQHAQSLAVLLAGQVIKYRQRHPPSPWWRFLVERASVEEGRLMLFVRNPQDPLVNGTYWSDAHALEPKVYSEIQILQVPEMIFSEGLDHGEEQT